MNRHQRLIGQLNGPVGDPLVPFLWWREVENKRCSLWKSGKRKKTVFFYKFLTNVHEYQADEMPKNDQFCACLVNWCPVNMVRVKKFWICFINHILRHVSWKENICENAPFFACCLLVSVTSKNSCFKLYVTIHTETSQIKHLECLLDV